MPRSFTYQPLLDFLSRESSTDLTMTYDQIERILGRSLPPSARGAHVRHFWANTETHSQARAWLRADWYVETVRGEQVRFKRRDPKSHAPDTHRRGLDYPASPAEKESDPIILRGLTPGAIRMLHDVAEEKSTDLAGAVSALLDHAAAERRRALLDWFAQNVPPTMSSSADLVREDRDTR